MQWFWRRLLISEKSRLRDSIHLVGRYCTRKTIHLPEIPRHNPCRLVQFIVCYTHAPALTQMLTKRLEHVDTRKEQVITLVFKTIGRFEGADCPFHPLMTRLGFLTHYTELAIEKSNTFIHRQDFTSNSIVARAHKRGFAAGYLQTWTLYISTPAVTLFLGKDDWLLTGMPCLIVFNVKNIPHSKPSSIYIVVHLIAKPRRGEDLGTRLCSLGLMFLFLSNTRLDNT